MKGYKIMNENIIHFWQAISTVSIGIIVTLLGFWASVGKKIVSREEIADMIKTESIYNQDRQFIMERLNTHKEDHKAMTVMLQRNTEVMHELKVQIATLGKTLETLEERIERN
jgi:hypothetical protein